MLASAAAGLAGSSDAVAVAAAVAVALAATVQPAAVQTAVVQAAAAQAAEELAATRALMRPATAIPMIATQRSKDMRPVLAMLSGSTATMASKLVKSAKVVDGLATLATTPSPLQIDFVVDLAAATGKGPSLAQATQMADRPRVFVQWIRRAEGAMVRALFVESMGDRAPEQHLCEYTRKQRE